MQDLNDDEEIKDLIKKKSRISKDPNKLNESGDVVFRIGYLYYHKGYYKEALDEFEQALEIRRKLPLNLDQATTHRFIGETLVKLEDFERAKKELDIYHSITLRISDLVETQRSHTTLGNYFMALAENNYKDKRKDHLNEAYFHYLKSYDLLNDIADKRLVDQKEFCLMKARTCLNCAFAMDEKRDLVICNEYLKTAIDICETNSFYEDLIRCLYIKCDQAKRKNKMEDMLKTADRIVEITAKSKDFVQQSQDFAFVADIYLKIQNLEKAKVLLRRAYKLKKKCLINPEITRKLKEVMNIMYIEKELVLFSSTGNLDLTSLKVRSDENVDVKLIKAYEKLGDSYCNIGLYEMGLRNYFKQLEISKRTNAPNLELSVIYASIAQTYNDLDKIPEAIKYFQLELDTCSLNSESECKSLLNIAILKEKAQVEFEELENVFKKAYEKAKEASNIQLQLKTMNLLRESQKLYRIDCEGTTKIINSLVEINKIKSNQSEESEKGTSDEDESEKEDNEDAESLVFSSDSDEDEMHQNNLFDEEKTIKQKSIAKKSIVKRNLRGETQLHVACIKGNYNLAKKLIEEGHPVNERDNLNWLPIHEACNYGHVQLVDLLIKHGAKVNDSIGPITPLHDAAQNGHLEVVKLLLKGGALSYVFTQEGYTPLDFLCKYKEDNEKNLNTSDFILYEELYSLMLNSIRGKDRNYKIKKVVFTDEDVVVETSNDADEEKLYSKSATKTSKNKLFDLDDEDDQSDEDDSDSGRSKDHDKSKKKKKAVSQYKQAINSIGSKSTSGTATMTLGKKGVDKVIVSEKEYNITEDWLINDLNSKKSLKKQPIKHQAATSTKRKYSSNYDDDGEMFEENEYEGDYLKERKQSKTLSDDDDDYEKDFRKISSKKTTDNSIQLPSSKKRLTDTDYDDHVKNRNSTEKVNKENLDIVRDTSNMSLNDIQYDFYNSDIYDNSESAVEASKLNDSPSKLKDKINNKVFFDNNNYGDDDLDNYVYNKNDAIDLTITSPFKNSTDSINKNKSKNKVQMKLDKIFSVKTTTSTTTSTKSAGFTDNKTSENSSTKILASGEPKNASSDKEIKKNNENWKIKAIIDNRNFLIPVSDINATIETLTEQIVKRYKTIFSNDPTYREPEKVILKSSDDLILFGQDLIKDVLTNFCQVNLVIETFKNAPTISEIYEQTCASKSLTIYSNIKSALKESETSFNLDLENINIDTRNATRQFDVIMESIKINSKHQLNNNAYFTNLLQINLSKNMLNDELLIAFVQNILVECLGLKSLDLSFNLATIKSLKSLCEIANTIKLNGKSSLFPLEYLNLSGNDFGCSLSKLNVDIPATLNSLITTFYTLKGLYISDCKLSFSDNAQDNTTENSLKRLYNSIKSSALSEIDISFNNFGYKFVTNLIENLPEIQIENLNLSNSLALKRSIINSEEESNRLSYLKSDLFTSLTKFISYNLTSISLRNLNLDTQQTTDIISCLGDCKQLKFIDLSYNSFEKNFIKLLFSECTSIEKAFLINSNNMQEDGSWYDIIGLKFDEVNVPLKHLEIKVADQNEKCEIKNLFYKKWHKNSIKLNYHSKNIIEYIVG